MKWIVVVFTLVCLAGSSLGDSGTKSWNLYKQISLDPLFTIDIFNKTTNDVEARYHYKIKLRDQILGLTLGSVKSSFLLKPGYSNKIEELAASGGIKQLDFGNGLKLASFFKTKIQNKFFPMVCRGEFYLAINGTEVEFTEVLELFETGKSNGYLISFQNLDCSPEGIAPLSVIMNFTIIQRSKFPYLSLDHTIKSSPFESFFNLKSTVRQVLNETYQDAYNTSVEIVSRSLFDSLNFNLNQTFQNQDAATGAETMSMISPTWTVVVDSLWNSNEFSKDAFLFYLNKTLKNLLSLKYSAKETDDFATLAVQFQKNLFNSFISYYNNEGKITDDNQAVRDEL